MDEAQELYQRKVRLAAFPGATLQDKVAASFLAAQLPVMEAYYRILVARLEHAGIDVYVEPARLDEDKVPYDWGRLRFQARLRESNTA